MFGIAAGTIFRRRLLLESRSEEISGVYLAIASVDGVVTAILDLRTQLCGAGNMTTASFESMTIMDRERKCAGSNVVECKQ